MSFLDAFLPELKKPEVTTIIRWFLRAVLVVFLAWLVRRRPDEEEEEDDEAEADVSHQAYDERRGGARGRYGASGPGARGGANPRLPRRDPYNPSSMRQRRSYGDAGGGGDVDAVIDKVSKPRDMWEVRRAGEGPPQILRQRRQEDGGDAVTPTDSGGAARGAAAAGLLSSLATASAASERPRLKLAPPSNAAANREAQARGEKTLHGHQRPVMFITWNRDGNLLFTCGKDKLVCVWSIPEGECLGQYKGHTGAVLSCSVTSDSKWLVTCGADRLVIVWVARASKELARVELPGVVRAVEWAAVGSTGEPPAERFVTCNNRFGSHAAALTIWSFDGTDIQEILRIADLPSPASQVRWGRGDETVASAHDNGELIFWRSDTGEEVKRLKAHDSAISKFDFSGDRDLVATVSHDKSVRIWDLADGADGRPLYRAETDRPINAVALGPITRAAAAGAPSQRPERCAVIAAGGQDARDVTTSSSSKEQFGTLMFRLGTAEELPCELEADGVTKGHFGPVHTLAFSSDGAFIASGSEDGCVRLHVLGGSGANTAATTASD